MKKEVTCLGQVNQVNQGNWCQEEYETSSRDAGRRARILRKAGYNVTVSSLGPQITRLGVIKLTMLNILPGSHESTCDLPPVKIDNI